MGVKYAWLLPKNKGLVPDAQDRITLASAESKLRVDVSSVHYSTIRYLYTNPTDINEAHTKLEYWMSKYGDKENTRFYVDGEVALEKSRTHIDRQQRRQVALAKADTGISDLESRLVEEKRVRKRHISTVYKNLRDGFHWSIEHRTSFVDFMKSKGYDIVLCQTEADVLIATECKPEDAVVSCDSDMLFYKTIPKVWRPVGSFKSRRFVPYEKTSLLQALGLSSTQLTALGILSGNDYVSNIPHLAIATNRKIVQTMQGDEKDIVRQYLAHPQVKRKIDQDGGCWTEDVYANAIKVFVTMQQSVVSESVLPPPASDSSLKDTTLSFTALTGRMKNFMLAFKENARKRTVDESSSRSINPFDTVDKQNPANAHSYRPRYSYKVRYEPSREQPEPAVSLQYTMKPWKDPPEKPASSTTPKRPVAAIKAQISGEDRFERKEMLDALSFEHPTVTLDLGRLSPNVNAAVENEPIVNGIIECIRGAVKVAWDTKRRCQMLIGLYLEDLFYPRPSPGAPRPATPVEIIGDDDQAILDSLCPRLSSREMEANNDDERPNEDGKDDGSNAPFIRSFLTFLYSGNSPGKNKTGNAVSTFISRLQDMGHLENYEGNRAEMSRNIKEFTPGFVVRSVASQLSVELKRHYRHGSEKLSEKVQTMIKKGVLAEDRAIDLTSKKPAIQLFVDANAAAGRPWRLSPLSSEEHGFMTFTEIELLAFLQKREELHPFLKKLIDSTDQQRRLSQTELTQDWLPLQTPGTVIQRLIAPVDPRTPDGECLHGRRKKDAGIAAAIRVVKPEEIHAHVNSLRHDNFDPRTYDKKGYFLRGSIKTDGYQLQLLAFKVRELNSVKFKRYTADVLPDRLLTTIAGTSDFLTEAHNVFKTTADVERLLGCTPDKTDRISYLGLDLGQAFVVGAYGLLSQDKTPRISRRRRRRQQMKQKKRGSRGRRNRGSRKGKKKGICQDRGQRHINLAAKQKAVARPTLIHRSWMEKQKGADLKIPSNPPVSTSTTDATTSEIFSIRTIESSLPALCGTDADFSDHLKWRQANDSQLDMFYNGKQFRHKKYKRMSKKARENEFHRLADSLLHMIGGSIGEKRQEDQVVIGIGMGHFNSTSRLSSLHGSFQSYFIQKARALGYLVIGVNEFYTSKKCPTCQQFVAQTESIRRLYCSHCKKYMHRDVMAANNIVNILRGHVEHQQRPLYLHPVDKDGHYPWLERGENNTAQPGDRLQQASGSSSGAGKRKTTDGDTDKPAKRTKGTMPKEKATTTKGRATTTKGRATTTKGQVETAKARAATTKGKAVHVDGR